MLARANWYQHAQIRSITDLYLGPRAFVQIAAPQVSGFCNVVKPRSVSMARSALQILVKILGCLPIIGGPIRRRAWYPYRHQMVLMFDARENVTFTQFLRLPHQGDALAGPVVDYLRPFGNAEPLRIVIFGCSSGAEPYSIASILASRRPEIPFQVLAMDIEQSVIDKAMTARYRREEVTKNVLFSDAFIASTFVEDDDFLEVRPELRARVTFQRADVLDPRAISQIEPADIVVAQNFLYHLSRRQSRAAFAHLCTLLKPRAALFIDGMDIDLRPKLTKKASLQPLDYLIPEIHTDAMHLRGGYWPWTYWGLEPLDTTRKDWKQRYATVYLRDHPAKATCEATNQAAGIS
jgi:chemotaxis protein methyltransferase CheR